MTTFDLLDAVGGVEPVLLEEMERPAAPSKPSRRLRWLAAAACLVLVIGLAAPRIAGLLPGKGGDDTEVEEITSLTFNGRFYEATDIPEVLSRFGLPEELGPELAGEHLAWLEPEGLEYRESALETDCELMQYAPSLCPGVYLLRDGEHWYAALFCGLIWLDSNQVTDMETLYQTYGIEVPADIASVAEVDWDRDKVTGAVVTDPEALAAFYDLTCSLTGFGNDDFQAMTFDGIPEEEQPAAHGAFADDLRMLRVETKAGLRFYLSFYPSYGWLEGTGVLTYYEVDEGLAAWFADQMD